LPRFFLENMPNWSFNPKNPPSLPPDFPQIPVFQPNRGSPSFSFHLVGTTIFNPVYVFSPYFFSTIHFLFFPFRGPLPCSAPSDFLSDTRSLTESDPFSLFFLSEDRVVLCFFFFTHGLNAWRWTLRTSLEGPCLFRPRGFFPRVIRFVLPPLHIAFFFCRAVSPRRSALFYVFF